MHNALDSAKCMCSVCLNKSLKPNPQAELSTQNHHCQQYTVCYVLVKSLLKLTPNKQCFYKPSYVLKQHSNITVEKHNELYNYK